MFARPSITSLRGPHQGGGTLGLLLCFAMAMGVWFGASPAGAQLNWEPEQLQDVGTADKRGEQVNPALQFTAWDGRSFRMGDFFDDELPVILLLAYYDCPLLCDLMIDAVRLALNENERLRPGRDFHLVLVSIDHTNTESMAAGKREAFIARYVHQDLTEVEARSVMFGLSEPQPVRELADSVGYYYRYLPQEQEYAHPPAIYFLTPDGVVSSMLLGINTPGQQVAMALNQASEGETAGLFASIVFSCFAFDPNTGQYTLAAMNVMRLGASLAAVFLLGFIGILFLRGWLRKRRAQARAGGSAAGGGSGGVSGPVSGGRAVSAES